MTFKHTVARAALAAIPSRRPALVVASFGRAGSTVVFTALSEGMARARLGRSSPRLNELLRTYCWDLGAESLKPGMVYKTHDYPDGLERTRRVKAVFMFGSMVDSALSVQAQLALKGPDWVARHFSHLRTADSFDNLLKRDALGFMAQTRAWAGFDARPVLCLRYEALWDHRARLSEFCGFEVNLPERRARRTVRHDPALLAAAEAVYGPLDARLAALPDCFVAAPESAACLPEAARP